MLTSLMTYVLGFVRREDKVCVIHLIDCSMKIPMRHSNQLCDFILDFMKELGTSKLSILSLKLEKNGSFKHPLQTTNITKG